MVKNNAFTLQIQIDPDMCDTPPLTKQDLVELKAYTRRFLRDLEQYGYTRHQTFLGEDLLEW